MGTDLQPTQWQLDRSQLAALDAARAAARLALLGAPGTGKTTVLEALVCRELAANSDAMIALVTQDRRAAFDVRNRLSLALGGLPGNVRVATLSSFAFHIVQAYAQAVGRRSPELISGPDEDSLIAAVLEDPTIHFPSFVTPEVRALPGFRAQIRDLITRAAELGYSAAELEELGQQRNEPIWVSGAAVMRSYELLTEARDAFAGDASAPDRLDHVHLLGAAAAMLSTWDDTASSPSGQKVIRPRWDWVLVDDAQNAPRSLLALLRQLAADGAGIIVAGDPDGAVQGFRGGVASLPGDLTAPAPLGMGLQPLYLAQRHRGGNALAGMADELVSCIRVGGGQVAQRRAQPGHGPDHVEGRSFVHAEEEAAAIARHMRELHVLEGVPYGAMAVVTRSRTMHSTLRNSLIRRGVPVEQVGSDRPLREQPAVSALLETVRLALGMPAHVEHVLTSLIVGIDPLELRRMQRVLRGYALAADAPVRLPDLLQLVVEGPERLSALAPRGVEPLMRAARLLQRIRQVAQTSHRQAEEVLWAAWDGSGRADAWQQQSLHAGVEGDAADAYLDSVIQLFHLAQRMADRDPHVTIEALLSEMELQNLPEDSIARMGAGIDAVALTTPAGCQGREWDHVVVAGLNEGVWPNLRLRDGYTHTGRLTQIATGREVGGGSEYRREAVEDVLDDELRLLHHSITRARRSLLITCTHSADSQPSRFFPAMGFGSNGPALRSPEPLQPDFDLTSLVGELRQALDTRAGVQAQGLLTRLQQEGVTAADPAHWLDELQPTAREGVSHAAHVSPSRVERLLDCPLQAFFSSIGGEDGDGTNAAQLGTLIHSIAEDYPHGSEAELLAALESRWRQVLPDPDSGQLAHRDYRRAQEMIRALAAYMAEHPEEVVTEQHLSVAIADNAHLSATLDRLSDSDDGVLIADLKTGKNVPGKAAAADNVQLQLYQWALERFTADGAANDPGKVNEHGAVNQRGAANQPGWLAERSPYGVRSAGAQLVYLRARLKSGMPTIREQQPLDSQTRQRAADRIRVAADLLAADQLPAHPSSLCRTCPFTAACPALPEGRMFS